jgi:hypothetical protein
VSLWSTNAVFSLNPSLPFCGHMYFRKATLKTSRLFVYEEGTTDRRQVADKVLELVTCPLLSEWGVLRLFCLWGEEESES